jgi:superfamily II DNA helicase RecQ
MNYRVFQYPLPCPEELPELNAWLGSHKIASVEQHLVKSGDAMMLVFIVQSAGNPLPSTESGSRERIDYKAVLPPEQFAVFSRLREVRKRLAEKEGVPVYSVFSNAQLAEMVKTPVHSIADMLKIDGVGQARVDKYGVYPKGISSQSPGLRGTSYPGNIPIRCVNPDGVVSLT